MAPDTKVSADFKAPTASKWRAPRAVVDGASGTLIGTAEVGAHPDYRQTEWAADLRVCGQWSVTVVFVDGNVNHGSGEFAEIDAPRKLVMTRRFEKHPLQGTLETTIRDVPAGVESRSRLFCPGRMESGSNLLPNRIFWARPIVFITA